MPPSGDLKKRLCNPPAEAIAEFGDPIVLGLFRSARAILEMPDTKGRDEALHEMAEAEQAYIAARMAAVDQVRSVFGPIIEKALAGF